MAKSVAPEPEVRSAPASQPPTAYDQHYFSHYFSNATKTGTLAYGRSEHWQSFFGGIADHIINDIAPRTVLDAGCAMGFLVEALRDRGVEAYGIDISEYAISKVRPDIKPFCRVGSVTDPMESQFDLIVSIEVLEHLSQEDAIKAVRNLCASTSDFIFSSTPQDYDEATHFNVQPPEWWTEVFGRQGFFRDVEYDPSTYISQWAVRYRRKADPISRVVGDYERLAWRLKRENAALRQQVNKQRALLDLYDDLKKDLAMIQRTRRVTSAPRNLARLLFPGGTSRGRWLRSVIQARQQKS
jgi:SAM-dependent methyltransferase